MAPERELDLTLEGLVHDLNNVFETISGAAELLEGDLKWNTVAMALHRSVERGRRMVNSYGAGVLAPQCFDRIVDTAVQFAQDLFRAVHAPPVKFVRHVPPGIYLCGTPAAWERVLINLFVNAAQSMKKGGTVEISAHKASDGIEVLVADSGSGIAPEVLPRIFEPHFSTRTSSSGLGLHIVKSIVARYGGVISAENRADRPGAAFRIYLKAGDKPAVSH